MNFNKKPEKKIIYLITEDSFFESHFLERAIAAYNEGFKIFLVTSISGRHLNIPEDKITIIPIKFSRSGLNPFSDLLTLKEILLIYHKLKPDILHHVALKPIVYGSIAAFLAKIDAKIVNAPVGMGFVFTSKSIKALVLRPFVNLLLKMTLGLRGAVVIFENPDDLKFAVEKKMVSNGNAVLIKGAGVDVSKFVPRESGNSIPVVTMVARMLVDKGVVEFIEAARIVNRDNSIALFNLVGDVDHSNRGSLSTDYLKAHSGSNGLNWVGFRENIADIYAGSDIACLPSYREGLPKSLIEAAACGLPIVTTDTIGCREVVLHGVNGFLVPIKSAASLAEAILHLISDCDLRAKMGRESRRRSVSEFSSQIVVARTLEIYRQ